MEDRPFQPDAPRQGCGFERRAAAQTRSAEHFRRMTSAGASRPRTPAPDFRAGTMVEHQTFGRGMVITATPMGSDALLEIAFDNHGTRKLLANSASAYMKKL